MCVGELAMCALLADLLPRNCPLGGQVKYLELNCNVVHFRSLPVGHKMPPTWLKKSVLTLCALEASSYQLLNRPRLAFRLAVYLHALNWDLRWAQINVKTAVKPLHICLYAVKVKCTSEVTIRKKLIFEWRESLICISVTGLERQILNTEYNIKSYINTDMELFWEAFLSFFMVSVLPTHVWKFSQFSGTELWHYYRVN